MACEHHNGNWIVFPMSEDKYENPPVKEGDSEEE
jgi:hypothetical protein